MTDLPHNVTTDDSAFRYHVVSTLAKLETILADHSKDNDDREKRIRALEESKWKASGVLSVVSFCASAIVSVVVRIFFR